MNEIDPVPPPPPHRAGPPYPWQWPDGQRPMGWGETHTDCNCGRTHGVTELDLLEQLVAEHGLEQYDASMVLWGPRPTSTAAAVEIAHACGEVADEINTALDRVEILEWLEDTGQPWELWHADWLRERVSFVLHSTAPVQDFVDMEAAA